MNFASKNDSDLQLYWEVKFKNGIEEKRESNLRERTI